MKLFIQGLGVGLGVAVGLGAILTVIVVVLEVRREHEFSQAVATSVRAMEQATAVTYQAREEVSRRATAVARATLEASRCDSPSKVTLTDFSRREEVTQTGGGRWWENYAVGVLRNTCTYPVRVLVRVSVLNAQGTQVLVESVPRNGMRLAPGEESRINERVSIRVTQDVAALRPEVIVSDCLGPFAC